jgi:hypothetical protein
LAPVAVHALGDVHDTALKSPPGDVFGNGTVWTRHFVPFHDSARGRASPVPVLW